MNLLKAVKQTMKRGAKWEVKVSCKQVVAMIIFAIEVIELLDNLPPLLIIQQWQIADIP
jgi:hypothetical protein